MTAGQLLVVVGVFFAIALIGLGVSIVYRIRRWRARRRFYR